MNGSGEKKNEKERLERLEQERQERLEKERLEREKHSKKRSSDKKPVTSSIQGIIKAKALSKKPPIKTDSDNDETDLKFDTVESSKPLESDDVEVASTTSSKRHKKKKKKEKKKKKKSKKSKKDQSDTEDPMPSQPAPKAVSPLATSPSPSVRSVSSSASRSPIRFVRDETISGGDGEVLPSANSPPVSPLKESSEDETISSHPPTTIANHLLSPGKKRKATTPSSTGSSANPSKRARKNRSPSMSPSTPHHQTLTPKRDLKFEAKDEVNGEDYPVQQGHREFIPISEFTPEYVALLQKVQDRISNPRHDDNLEGIVKLVQQTNCFALDNDSFKFDLCLLDKRTVIKITQKLGIK